MSLGGVFFLFLSVVFFASFLTLHEQRDVGVIQLFSFFYFNPFALTDVINLKVQFVLHVLLIDCLSFSLQSYITKRHMHVSLVLLKMESL